MNDAIFTPKDGEPIRLTDVLEITFDDCPIDPDSTRKPEVKGQKFRLADGRYWTLASPSIRIRPTIVDGKVTGTEGKWDYPPAIREKVLALMASVMGDEPEIPFDLIVDAGVHLVMEAHNLTLHQAVSLFEIAVSEVEELLLGMLRMFRGESVHPEEPESQESA